MDEVRGFRLSPQQARLWALGQDGSPYRAQAVVELAGPPDAERLRRALAAVVREHEIFRTRFVRPAGLGLPVQVVGEGEGTVLHASPGPEPPEWDRLLAREWAEAAEGLRCLIVEDGGRCSLVLTLPAMLADEETLVQLVRHLSSAYAGGGVGEPVSYVQYAGWRHRLLEEGAEEARTAQELFALPEDPGTLLPWARDGRPEPATAPPARAAVSLPRPPATFEAVAGELGVSLTDLLLAAWRLLLHRLGGRVVAVVFAGRADEELAACCGPLAVTVPCALAPEPGERFADTTARTAAWRSQAEEWLDWFAPGGEPRMAEAGFRFRDLFGQEDAAFFSLQSFHARQEPLALELVATRTPAGLTLELLYDRQQLPAIEIERTAERLATLLAGALDRPQAAVAELAAVGASELSELAALGVSPAVPVPAGCLHELIAARAACEPQRPAVLSAAGDLTYGELVRRANGLARRLAARGVGPEVPVGVVARRDADLVVALLAVLTAGGCYVLLDPDLPPRRLELLAGDAGIRVLVAAGDPAAVAETAAAGGLDVLIPAGDGEVPEGETPLPVGPDHLAYVLYTSGSAGRPKGVMVSHGALASYLHWASTSYPVAAGERSLVASPASFDLTVTTLFLPLLSGGIVELVPESAGLEGLAAALGRGGRPGLMKLTPSQLSLLDRLVERTADGPRSLVLGGEALRRAVAEPWVARPGTRVFNEYGPTETTVGITAYEILGGDAQEGTETPIGRPIANARLHVVDARLLPVPWGAAGELLLGGPGLARGYLGSPDATAARFIPDPFSGEPGARLYRSGDLARWRADGELLFLGRNDGQLKIRGFRVEPGEVEAALCRHPAVGEALAMADPADAARLIAYWVARGGRQATPEELKAFLGEQLPEHMVPSRLVPLDAMPLTRHGKIDRAALPAPGAAPAAERARVAPRDDLEGVLAGCWAEVLGVAAVGVRDDFFDLGGHSMLAMQLAARISDDFRLDMPLHVLLEARTVEALAATLRRHEKVAGRTDKIAAALARIRGLSEEDLGALLAEKRRDQEVPA